MRKGLGTKSPLHTQPHKRACPPILRSPHVSQTRVRLDRLPLSSLLRGKRTVPPTPKGGSAHKIPGIWQISARPHTPRAPGTSRSLLCHREDSGEALGHSNPGGPRRARAALVPASAGLALRGRGALGAGPAAPPGKLSEAGCYRHILRSSGSRRAESSRARTKRSGPTARASRTLSHGAPDRHPW